MSSMKYLFVDSNNLGVRASFANKDLGIDMLDYGKEDFNPDDVLKHESRFPTGAMHGFFRTIASIRRAYPDRYICVVWDGKSKSRILATREAVKAGLIPEEYKENRKKGKPAEQYINFQRQRPEIMAALSMTNIPQVVKVDEEADDVIASYVTSLAGNDIVILTGDHDYYQVLGDGVTILDTTGTVLDETWFRKVYGISPAQWVEVGGMCGDHGDGISGVPWIGEGTALREVAKHGSCAAIMEQYHKTYDCLREKFPDVSGDEFKALREAKTADEKFKFPGVKEWMPFTGVALAYEKGAVKIPRNVIMALVYEQRIPLARELKAMHRQIPIPPLPPKLGRNKITEFIAFCRKYALEEVERMADLICREQP